MGFQSFSRTNRCRSRGPIFVVCVVLAARSVFAAGPELHQPQPDRLILVEPGPIEQAVLHADGSIINLETETVWRYMCGSNTADLTIEDMRTHVQRIQAGFAEGRSDDPPAAATGAGLNITWNIGGGLSAEAQTALEEAAQYIERQFGDPITVSISVQMINMGPGVLGSTGSFYSGAPGWSTVRSGLISDMDGDDTIQNFLPSGTTIPVRYNASSSIVTNETRVWFTKANFNAALGSSPGTAATMSFNSQFPFDFDPSNGISVGTWDFQSIVVHEVGHALGFTSRTAFQDNDINALDIFRFQNTDGAGDYNPDTEAEFGTTARTVDFNNLNDDVLSDLISAQYRMEDGSPWQASHFRTSVSALMDPNIGSGQSFYPNFYKSPDLNMFDAIGYDYPALPSPSAPPFPDGAPKNRYISFLPNNGDFETAFQVEITAGPGTLGVLGWAGEPDAEGRSSMVDQAFYTADWPDPVHVGGCEIVPVATYEVSGIILGFDEGNPDFFSPSLEVSTIPQPAPKFWADSAGELLGSVWSGPNGVTNFQDVVAVLQTFSVESTAPPKTWSDIHPQTPNRIVNIDDVFNTILAFQGATYPYDAPSDCP